MINLSRSESPSHPHLGDCKCKVPFLNCLPVNLCGLWSSMVYKLLSVRPSQTSTVAEARLILMISPIQHHQSWWCIYLCLLYLFLSCRYTMLRKNAVHSSSREMRCPVSTKRSAGYTMMATTMRTTTTSSNLARNGRTATKLNPSLARDLLDRSVYARISACVTLMSPILWKQLAVLGLFCYDTDVCVRKLLIGRMLCASKLGLPLAVSCVLILTYSPSFILTYST